VAVPEHARSAGRRIGLFGGSFDPVHLAHRMLGDAALAQLQLDELRWVIAGQPWQKAGRVMAPAERRAEMVELAIADEPRHRVERCELDRDGPSYTLDTVRELQAGADPANLADTWFLVIGQDQYANFCSWYGWRELVGRVTLAVAGRAGDEPEASPELAAELARTAHRVFDLQMPPSPISATALRAALGAGQSPATLVPQMLHPAVADCIERERLYHPVPAAP
jgi:nicotinate-nucleotide adenylyltransferase